MVHKILFGESPDGAPLASVLAKATFRIAPGLCDADTLEPIPFWEGPVLEEGSNPLNSPVIYDSDLVAYQPYCQVVVHGEACAPQGKRARFFDMGVSVAGHYRKIRAFGSRTVDASSGSLRFSEPESFDRMPLKLSMAYGGQNGGVINPYNPFGKGFWIESEPAAMHGSALPNLEDPLHLLEPSNLLLRHPDKLHQAPRPAFLGALPQVGEGIPGFVVPYLAGGEVITLAYMDPEHPQFTIALPKAKPTLGLNFGEGLTILTPRLQKIEIDKTKGSMTMLWCASSYCGSLESLSQCPCMDVFAEMGG